MLKTFTPLYFLHIFEKGGDFIFADHILKIRRKHRMSKSGFAEVIGVTRQTVSNWENGTTTPSANMIARIAYALGEPIEEITHVEKYKKTEVGPKERYFLGKAKVNKSGKLLLGKEILETLDMRPGDELLVLGDIERGIELLPVDELWENRLDKMVNKKDFDIDNSNSYCYYSCNR